MTSVGGMGSGVTAMRVTRVWVSVLDSNPMRVAIVSSTKWLLIVWFGSFVSGKLRGFCLWELPLTVFAVVGNLIQIREMTCSRPRRLDSAGIRVQWHSSELIAGSKKHFHCDA